MIVRPDGGVECETDAEREAMRMMAEGRIQCTMWQPGRIRCAWNPETKTYDCVENPDAPTITRVWVDGKEHKCKT